MRPAMLSMLLAMPILTGCATNGPGQTNSFCSAARPILMDKADKLSDRTARAIVGHNEIGARLCGWKPPA